MGKLIERLWSEEQGQDIAEYAVMLAVILVLVVGTIRLIGGSSNNVFLVGRELDRSVNGCAGSPELPVAYSALSPLLPWISSEQAVVRIKKLGACPTDPSCTV